MKSAYIGKLRSDKISYLPILYPNLGKIYKEGRIFLNNAFDVLKKPVIRIEDDPSKADFILIPYEYYFIRHDKAYIQSFVGLAQKYKKTLVIFDPSDFDYEINYPNSIVLRYSQYKYKKKDYEIIIPPFAEDLLGDQPIKILQKKELPIVGFVGWAGLKNVTQFIKFYIKTFWVDIKSIFDSHLRATKKGIYFRRKAIKYLKMSSLVKTSFIVRKSFSGHSNDIEIDPTIARSDYIKNIEESDFILAPKGDGNYSIRFYEILSMGRIPILIDTETLLPLEDVMDYDKFIVRVDYKDISKLPEITSRIYSNLDNDSFAKMQIEARRAFVDHLRMDVFLTRLFEDIIK